MKNRLIIEALVDDGFDVEQILLHLADRLEEVDSSLMSDLLEDIYD